nr:helicase [Tanacetum cinerariifolium]
MNTGLAISSIPEKGPTNLKGKAFADARNVTPPEPGVEISYRSLGGPTYACPNCNATMWIDHLINKGMGLYTFRINGQNYHRIRSLLPTAGTQPRYAQLWFFDTHNEIRNRFGALMDTDNKEGVNGTKVGSLIRMLDANSANTKSFW